MRKPVRFILDSNVWRYLVDADAVDALDRAIRKSENSISVSPATLYEAARFHDDTLRSRLFEALMRKSWKRLLPEAYFEAIEIKNEVSRVRPEWLQVKPDLGIARRFRYDWVRVKGGNWDRVVAEPRNTRVMDSDRLSLARKQAHERREESKRLSSEWERMPLKKILARPAGTVDGSHVESIEAWRVAGFNAFYSATTDESHPLSDWIGGEVDIVLMKFQISELRKFWFHEVELRRMPRHWLRWAFEYLQGFRRVTDGTPVDSQLGTYLLDADVLITADKALVWQARRVRDESPFKIGAAKLVGAGNAGVEEVLRHLSGSSQVDA